MRYEKDTPAGMKCVYVYACVCVCARITHLCVLGRPYQYGCVCAVNMQVHLCGLVYEIYIYV